MTQAAKKKIAKKADVWHLVQRGELTRMYYDSETGGLNRFYPGMLSFGGDLTDIAGNELHNFDYLSRCPSDTVPSPIALLVNRLKPEDLDKGDAPHIFAGKVAWLFRKAHEYLWDACTESTEIEHESGKTEEVRLYPLEVDHEDGSTSIEYVRVHNGGRDISYRVDNPHEEWSYRDDEGCWRRVRAATGARGYNNANADDRWLWSTWFMAGLPDTFLTHTKKERKYRVDNFPLTIMMHLFGPQNEEGIRLGTRTNPLNPDESLPSLQLSKIMQANTRSESTRRGVREGVTNPDGSRYEEEESHGARYDARATRGLDDYERMIAPDLMQLVEECADIELMKSLLMEDRDDKSDRPLLGFGRYRFPSAPTKHMGLCVGIDEMYGDWRQAVLLCLDGLQIDPKNPERIRTADGKDLFNLSADEMAIMMQGQFKGGQSLFETIHLKKTPMVVPKDMALDAGANHGRSPDELEALRRLIVTNRSFLHTVMLAYEKNLPNMSYLHDSANPLPDELALLAVGELDFYKVKTPEGRTVILDKDSDVYFHASNRWDSARRIDSALKRAIEPDPVEWMDDEESLAAFSGKIKKIRKDLEKYQQHVDAADTRSLPNAPMRSFRTPEQARDYLRSLRWEVLWSAYNNSEHFAFFDYSRHFRITDRNGHEVAWDDYVNMDHQDRRQKWERGELNIVFESLDLTPQIIVRMMYESGDLDRMEEILKQKADKALTRSSGTKFREQLACLDEWRAFYEARIAYLNFGPPNEAPKDHRAGSIRKGLEELENVENNIRMARDGKKVVVSEHEMGAYEQLTSGEGKHQAEAIINGWRARFEPRLAQERYQLTGDRMLAMGLDPLTGWPMPHARYEYPAEFFPPFTLEVPDTHIENPLKHPRLGNKVLMVQLPADLKHMQKWFRQGGQLALKGSETGTPYLAAKPVIMPLWDESMDGYFSEIMAQARAGYTDSGRNLPKNRDRLALLAVEDLPLLANTRIPDLGKPVVKVPHRPARNDFVAMVSPLLGNRAKTDGVIKGLMIRDYGHAPVPGVTRFRELDADGEETGREVEARVTKVRRLSLAGLKAEVESGKFTDKMARRYGYSGTLQMIDEVSGWFVNLKKDPNDPGNTLFVLDFNKADKSTMTYFAPGKKIVATVARDTLLTAAPEQNNDPDAAAELTRRNGYTARRSGPQPS